MLDKDIRVPTHHLRYAQAWSLYQDKGLSEESRLTLEKEMDNAQVEFTFAEFQIFKQTLPGFVAHWEKFTKVHAEQA